MVVRLLYSIIVFFVVSLNIYAQDANPLEPAQKGKPIYIGPVAGFNRSLHTVELATFKESVVQCPVFTDGNANGFYAGLSFEYMLGDLKKSNSSIIGRVLYNTMPASFTQTGDYYPSLVDNGTGGTDVVYSETQHIMEVSYSMFTIEAMYKLNLFDTELGITVGPALDFPMTKTVLQQYKLTRPNNVQFNRIPEDEQQAKNIVYKDNDRTIEVKNGDIDNASGVRMAVKAGLQYEIILKNKWYVVPSFYYNFPVTKVTSAEDWRVSAIQIGVDLRYAL